MTVALNPTAMRAVLQRILFRSSARQSASPKITACTIQRIKHKPGRYCQVGYRIEVISAPHCTSQVHLLSARVYPPGVSTDRYRKAVRQPLVPASLREPVFHFPELDMVLWVFPNDRKLERLPAFIDPQTLTASVLPVLLRSHFGNDWRIEKLNQRIAHYTPEYTCMQRLELLLRREPENSGKEGPKQMPLVIYGKTYATALEAAQCYINMLWLWESESRRLGRFRMAMPLGFHAETQSQWQLGLQGDPLIALPLSTPALVNRFFPAAACVAALHAIPLRIHQTTSLHALLQQLEIVRERVAVTCPEARTAICRLTGMLLQRAAHLPSAPPVLLHGDLHLKNFILAHDQVYLIDLDNLTRGPAAQDLGSFAAALMYRGLIENIDMRRVDRLNTVFVRTYMRHRPAGVTPFEIQWYTAAMLVVERIYRCLSRLKAGRLAIVPALIQQAERVLSSAECSASGANNGITG